MRQNSTDRDVGKTLDELLSMDEREFCEQVADYYDVDPSKVSLASSMAGNEIVRIRGERFAGPGNETEQVARFLSSDAGGLTLAEMDGHDFTEIRDETDEEGSA